MIVDQLSEIFFDDVFLRLDNFVPNAEVLLKIEGLNVAGSIKLKPARAMIDDLERTGTLMPGGRVIESSSGNLGIALAVICAERGYRFECVCDPNTLPRTLKILRAYRAAVKIVSRRDSNGGYLQSRIDFIQSRLQADPQLVWCNQYANPANRHAHYTWTAAAILQEVPHVDLIFVGVGSSGTLMGTVDYVARHAPNVRVVGVDVVGSVTFGAEPGNRFIPGLGASRRPELYDGSARIEKVLITEEDTAFVARELLDQRGFLVGGSTATVLAAVRRKSAGIPLGTTIVAISPDLGERYVETVFDDEWLAEKLPGAVKQRRFEAAS